jgi:hypothetical protein
MTISYLTIAAAIAIPTLLFLVGVARKKWASKRRNHETKRVGYVYHEIGRVVDELLALTHSQAFKVLDSENFEPAWIPAFPIGMESDLRSQVYENYFRLLEGKPLLQPKTTGKQVELATQLNGYGWSNFFPDIKQEVDQLAQEMTQTAATNYAGEPDIANIEAASIFFWGKGATSPGSGELHQLFSTLRSRAQKKQEEETEVASNDFFDEFPEDDEPEDGFVLIQGDEEPSPEAIAEELGEQKLSQKQLVAATLELFATVFPLEQFRTMRLSHNPVKIQMQYNAHRYLAGNPQAIAHPEETITRIVKDYMSLPGCDPRAIAVFIDLLNSVYSQSQIIAATSPDQPAFSFDDWISGEVFAGPQFNSLVDDLDIVRYFWKHPNKPSAFALIASTLDPVLVLSNYNKKIPELFGLARRDDLGGFLDPKCHQELIQEISGINPPSAQQFLDLLRDDRFLINPASEEVVATEVAVAQLVNSSPAWAEFFKAARNLLSDSIINLVAEFESTGEGLSFSPYGLQVAMQLKLDEQNGRSPSVDPVETITVATPEVLPHLDEGIVARVFEDDPLGVGGTLPELREHFCGISHSDAQKIPVQFCFADLYTFPKQPNEDMGLVDRLKSVADFSRFVQDNYPEEYGVGPAIFSSSKQDGAVSCRFFLAKEKMSEFFNRLHEEYPHLDDCTTVSLASHGIMKQGTLPELREFFR